MSDARLEIHIGADVKEALAGFRQTGAEATALGGKVKALDDTFEVLNTGLNQSSGYMKQQSAAVKALGDALSEAQSHVSAMGDKFKATLSQQRVALNDLARAFTGTGFSARSLGSQLTLFPLPVVAAAAAAIGLGLALVKMSASQSDAEKAQQKLNQTMAESAATSQGEIAEIKDLTGIILNEANSRDVRTKAFKKLQDEYPNAFKNMSLEKTSLKELQVEVNKLTDAIIRQAQIKGLEGAISDVYKEQAKLLTESTSQVLRGADAWDKLKAAATAAGIQGLVGFKNAAVAGALRIVGDEANASKVQVAALNDQLKKLLTTSLTKGDDQLLSSKSTTPSADKTQSETLRFLEETKKNLEDIQKVDLRPVFEQFNETVEGEFGKLNADIVKQKIAKAIEDGAKDGVSKANVQALVDSIQALGDKQANKNLSVPIGIKLEDETKPLDDKLKTVVGRLDKDAFIKIHIDAKQISPELAELDAQIGKILSDFSAEAVEGVAEAIGTAIGKGTNVLSAAGSELESLIGEALESLGKALIKYGIGQEAVEVSLDSFNPELAIAAGIAAEIAGAALKSSVHAFATGGIVTAPMMGLVGEAGPEVIFPLSKLQQFVQANNPGGIANINVRGKLSGPDLLILHDRSVKSRNLV